MTFNEIKSENAFSDDKLNSRVGRVFMATKSGFENSNNQESNTHNYQD